MLDPRHGGAPRVSKEGGAKVLVVVDVQGKLAEGMFDRGRLYDSLQRLIRGVKAIGIPILWCEQNPAKMGATVDAIRPLLLPETPIPKMSFSCWGEPRFVERLKEMERVQVFLAGIETHVCILQTASDLLAQGYDVSVVADAVSSRTELNWQIGLELARARGAEVTSVETLLLEHVGSATHPAFREILGIIK